MKPIRHFLSRQGPYNIMPSPEWATECVTGVIAAAVEKVDEDANGAELVELWTDLVMLVKVVEDKRGVDIAVVELLEVVSGIVGAGVDWVFFPMDAVEILGEFGDEAQDIGVIVASKGFTEIKLIP